MLIYVVCTANPFLGLEPNPSPTSYNVGQAIDTVPGNKNAANGLFCTRSRPLRMKIASQVPTLRYVSRQADTEALEEAVYPAASIVSEGPNLTNNRRTEGIILTVDTKTSEDNLEGNLEPHALETGMEEVPCPSIYSRHRQPQL